MNIIKNHIKSIIGMVFKYYCLISGKLNGKAFILMYHRVREDTNTPILYDSAMFVSKKTLENNIKELSRYFDITSLDDLKVNPLDRRPKCVLTFDDGWADNYYYALPILKTLNVPATIFVTVNYMGTNKSFWFHDIWNIAGVCLDKGLNNEFFSYFKKHVRYNGENIIDESNVSCLIASIKELNPELIDNIVADAYHALNIEISNIPTMLNWKQIEEMSRLGMEIGSHGMNHYILTNITNEQKTAEISDSLSIMKKYLNKVCTHFCYPNGNYDNKTIQIVKDTGYKGAISTTLGFNTSRSDQFALNRIAIHDDIAYSNGLLWFRLFQAIC